MSGARVARDRTNVQEQRTFGSPGARWSAWLPMLIGMFCLYLALPPVRFGLLGWVAPLAWSVIVGRQDLPGRHPYLTLWLFGGVFWIAVLQGVRLAHWANYFGLIGLGIYFGIFWPVFVAAARTVTSVGRIPLPLSMALSWAAVEWLRSLGPLGFTGAMLAHTQSNHPSMIQAADVAGGYGVSFAIVLVSASALAAWNAWPRRAAATMWLTVSVTMLLAMTVYGRYCLGRGTAADRTDGAREIRFALLQGSIDTEFTDDPTRAERMLDEYMGLTRRAIATEPRPDVIIWPESMFPFDGVVFETEGEPGPGYDRTTLENAKANFDRMVRHVAAGVNPSGSARPTYVILGTGFWHFDGGSPRHYNSAILVAPDGSVVARYDKMHPVIFGEYVPLGSVFPWLYRLMPMPSGLSAGKGPVSFQVAGIRLAPNICFESILPQLIRRHVVELRRNGTPPDVLVNLTNDGWFWGSSILDLHLQSNIFRAVEMRRPVLVAANTGISAVIDACGRVVTRGGKRETQVLRGVIAVSAHDSPYLHVGEWPWLASMAVICCLALYYRCQQFRKKHDRLAASP